MRSRFSFTAVLLTAVAFTALAPADRPRANQSHAGLKERGPAVGSKLPQFKARDQFGNEQTPASLVGEKGAVLLFFRSADW